MASLTPNQRDFLAGIYKDKRLRRWGMEKLSKRDDTLSFLVPMTEMGFFTPTENPAPVEDSEGKVSISPWDAMLYLEKAASQAGKDECIEASHEILQILRSVTSFKGKDGIPTDNIATWNSFAKILASLPPASYEAEDLEMLRVWLGSRFDRGMMIGATIGTHLLPTLLKSEESERCAKIRTTLNAATQIKWIGGSSPRAIDEAATAVDAYWLGKLFERHSSKLGAICGDEISSLLIGRIDELLAPHHEDNYSWFIRPAIEDHPQNRTHREVYNVLINGLRDIAISYIDTQFEPATQKLESMLESKTSLVKRIAIHVIDERFGRLSDLFILRCQSIFELPLIHETYRLLKRHFGALTKENQNAIVTSIRNIETSGKEESAIKRIRERLAHAIHGQGNEFAEKLFVELESKVWDRGDMHPDFLSYTTIWSGHGKSLYSVDQLRALGDEELVENLNSFQQDGAAIPGPEATTVTALSDAITQLVEEDPDRFVNFLRLAPRLKPAYQFSVLNGFRNLLQRDTGKGEGRVRWFQFWPSMLEYLRRTAAAGLPWNKPDNADVGGWSPSERWLVPVMADLIKLGTNDDSRAIPQDFVREAFDILKSLLDRETSDAIGREDDAMTEAINTGRGHCLEALFDLSLYICRNGDKRAQSHAEDWNWLQPEFDRQLSECRGGNFEFSTICGSRIHNIHYLSRGWLEENVAGIFPLQEEFERNFDCAIQGLAYSQGPIREIYLLLRGKSVIKHALARSSQGRHARERLLQYISVAYLWGDEDFSSPGGALQPLFSAFPEADIREIVRFFWGIQREQLRQEQVEKIIGFWGACMSRIDTEKVDHRSVLSDLGLLTAYLRSIEGEQERWLLEIAPYIDVNHNANFLLEYLDALVEASPSRVASITLAIAKSTRGYSDFAGRFESIVEKLFRLGHRDAAKAICNQEGLLDLPGVEKLYREHVG